MITISEIKDLKSLEFLRHVRRAVWYYKEVKKFRKHVHYDRNKCYLILGLEYGNGDIYIICSLLQEFKRTHNIDHLTLLIIKPSHAQIIDLFENIGEVILLEMPAPFFLNKITPVKKGEFQNYHPLFLPDGFVNLIGYKNCTLMDAYKILLDIPLKTTPGLPERKTTQEDLKVVESLFQDKNLRKGKTIILAPEAVAIEELRLDFWLLLVEAIKKLDYDVVIMAYKDLYANVDIPKIDFPLRSALSVVEYAGCLISLRSGFCDVISSASAKKIIFYPKVQWHGGDFIVGASIREMFNQGSADLFELEYQTQTEKEVIGQVISILNS